MSIGDTLTEARRQAGLTITQVSQRTRIRESIIRGIETNDFSACGGDFYARGHIRSIATAEGIDSEPLIREYDAEHGPVGGSISAADVFEPATPIKIRERRSPSLSMIVVVLLLGIIGFSAYHLVSSHSHKAAAAARTTPHATAVRATPRPSPRPTPASMQAPRNEVRIHLTALQDCWVLITRTDTGAQIYMGVIPAGGSASWTEKKAVSLRLGNPPGVVLTVDGKHRNTNTPNVLTLNLSPPNA
ncbi:MAG TPA: RodZ domain-containing protein [Streptosporangiaceae bacterium]